jgi:hypothetical protein
LKIRKINDEKVTSQREEIREVKEKEENLEKS